MPRTAAVAALVMLIAAPAFAQPAPIEPLVAHWKGCVVQSYQAQRSAMPDASMAAEVAFNACQTEEDALFLSRPAPPEIVAQYRALYRAKMKSGLVSIR